MRKLLISLLLASAAASPALADPPDNDDRHAARAERQQARNEARQESHADRAVQVERPQFSGGNHFNGQQHLEPNAGPDPREVEASRFSGHDAPESVHNGRGERRQQVIDQREQVIEGDPQVMPDRRERFGNGELRHSDRPLPPVMRTRVPVVSDVPQPGTQPPLRVENHRRDDVRWSTDWRRDRRYDWRDWRRRHRSWFNLGIYYDPFGWGYQPYSIGWRLWPSYYSSNFWINNPWQYRLPYAPPGTRWVRYYDDALLVDTWTGQVVDVIYNFFW
jgi:hypothetical protein